MHVIFLRQYEHAAGRILLWLPGGVGGVVEEGKTDSPPAARRELLEATGYTSDEVQQLAEVTDNPTKDTNRIYFFLARNVRHVAAQDLDETENIEVVLMPLTEVEILCWMVASAFPAQWRCTCWRCGRWGQGS